MDFLQSLNIHDLPEQQTRTRHLEDEHPDFDLKLGFDACCTCGKSSPKFECSKCNRVMYCSHNCREKDAQISCDDDDLQATGHSSVICALLTLCNDDEIIDEGNDNEIATLSIDRQESAKERVASEYESYPATLANAIADIPLFQRTLQKCRGDNLKIHVLGAAEESELWGNHPNRTQQKSVWQCYADALAETAENFNLRSIELDFIGPECPDAAVNKYVTIPPVKSKKSLSSLHVTTSRKAYTMSQSSVPNILIFFNPGFTCPDYNWKDTVSLMKDNIDIPFIVTTNTELEAIADLQYLWDLGLIQEIPAGLISMFEGNNSEEDQTNFNEQGKTEQDLGSFLSLNPFCGMRVRQNGTMANDLYIKSRWMFGGLTGSPSRRNTEDPPAKKKHKTNSKKSNPALV